MKIYILLIIFFCSIFSVKGQQQMTLYGMDRVLQSHFTNPSMESSYKVQVGGIIIPVVGQLPPPIYLGVSNSSFGFSDIFKEGKGSKSGKLILDLSSLVKRHGNADNIKIDLDVDLFLLGFSVKDKFFTISLTEKVKGDVIIPYDLFEFVVNGNASYMHQNKPHDMSKLNANFTHYRKLGFGGTVFSNDNLRVGARANIIFGMANANITTNKFYIKTNPDDYKMSLFADMDVNFSLPFYFDYEKYGNDSINIEINKESKDAITAQNYLLNTSNLGFGLDFGVTYKLNEKIDLFGSVTDLGFIKWHTNTQQFTINGLYEDFQGIPIQVEDDVIELGDYLSEVIDSITNQLRPTLKEESYKTNLSANIYLGGKFKFHEKFNVGATYRGEFYKSSYLQSFSLLLNANLTNWFSLHTSYTVTNRTWLNIGIGSTLRAGPFNWFIVTDNFFSAIFPEKTRSINIRFGCNMVFGVKNKRGQKA